MKKLGPVLSHFCSGPVFDGTRPNRNCTYSMGGEGSSVKVIITVLLENITQ